MNNTEQYTFGGLLSTFRKRKRLTQQQVAAAIGVHRNAIGRWEQGDFLPESKAMVLELARHLSLDDLEARQLLEASFTALVPPWLVPYQRNPFFTGRQDLLDALQHRISTDQAARFTRSYAFYGLGGVGKTHLAIEYAYRHALEYSAIFWIRAESSEHIITSFQSIAELLHLPERLLNCCAGVPFSIPMRFLRNSLRQVLPTWGLYYNRLPLIPTS